MSPYVPTNPKILYVVENLFSWVCGNNYDCYHYILITCQIVCRCIRRRAILRRGRAATSCVRTSSSASPRRGCRAAASSDGRARPARAAPPPPPRTKQPTWYYSKVDRKHTHLYYIFRPTTFWLVHQINSRRGWDLLLYFYIREYTYFVS